MGILFLLALRVTTYIVIGVERASENGKVPI
jgi:hypothetical protein